MDAPSIFRLDQTDVGFQPILQVRYDMSATTAAPPDEVKAYQYAKLMGSVLSTVVSLAALTVAALWLGPRLDEALAAVLPQNSALRLLVFGLLYGLGLELLSLPFSFWSSYILEHRHGLSTLSLSGWIWRHLKANLLGLALGLPLLLGFYAFLWYAGTLWWLWATVGWLGMTLVLGRLLPVVILPLFYKTVPLEDADLLERLRRLTVGTSLRIEGVYRMSLSEETKKANAALAGMGRTRRVLLGDTLLDQFTPEEIEVVFAHEVGHHVYRHLPLMIGISVVLTGMAFWLVDRILHLTAAPLGYRDLADPAALPLVALVLTLFSMILGPLQNALSRVFERQCDRYALEQTRQPEAYRSAFEKLARLNKVDPDPHPLVVWLFDDHPPIRERLALADALFERSAPLS